MSESLDRMAGKVLILRPRARKQASTWLRRRRCALALSQEEAARRCGVSARTWGAWERGDVAMLALEAVCVLEEMLEERTRRAA